MKYLILLIIVGLLGCKESDLKMRLKQANEVSIHFYYNSQSDSVIKIVHTNSKLAIGKLADFIDRKEVSNKFCGHDGDIVFIKNNKVIDTVYFNALQKSCRQFYFTINGRIASTTVSNEAADFLTSLWAGNSKY
ncbi:MAG: hypothetical protein ACJ748_14425 [Flavisolibacter sp.]